MAGTEQSIDIRAPIGQVHDCWTEWAAGSGGSAAVPETLDAVGMLQLEPLDENTTRVRLRLDEGSEDVGERVARFLQGFKQRAERPTTP